MKVSVVLDVSYGDCGKGRVVDSIIDKKEKNLVVRFSGGHQALHNVSHGEISHIFSNLGSGTLKGADTLWDEYCTFYPITFINEYYVLKDKVDFSSINIYIDENAKVCTIYDVLINQNLELSNQHGSCGLGVGHTIYRHETDDHAYQIYARDLKYPWILKTKLENFKKYFYTGITQNNDTSQINELEEQYLSACDIIRRMPNVHIISTDSKTNLLFGDKYDHIIFEGSQGILLDRDFGVAFPNVTRSYTTYKNILSYLNTYIMILDIKPDIYYVSRCYQTRHGNGPLLGEDAFDMNIYFDFNGETNSYNRWQGEFRYAPISFDMIEYAISCNRSLDPYVNDNVESYMIYTCIDQYRNTNLGPGNVEIPIAGTNAVYISTIYPSIEVFCINNTPAGILNDNILFSKSRESNSELYHFQTQL